MKKIYFLYIFLILHSLLIKKMNAQQGSALSFDGSNDEVVVSNSGNYFESSSFTFECWVKKTNATSGSLKDRLMMSEGSNGWGVAIQPDGRILFAKVDVTAVFSTGTINNTNWHHVAVTHDGSTTKFYIDGSLDATVSFSASFSSGGNYGIGNRLSHGENFDGYLDEVRVWNYVRSATEVYDNMNCELTGIQTGLLAYYKFNQAVAGGNNAGENTLTDASGNAHNGTLNNFALNGSSSNWVTPGGVSSNTFCSPTTCYQDSDGDGYGNPAISQVSLTLPSGYVLDNSDCNDAPGSGASIHPGAYDMPGNGIDEDCSGSDALLAGALSFDGSNDEVVVSNSGNYFEPPSFTFECWVKKANATSGSLKDRLMMSEGSNGWGVAIQPDGRILFAKVDVAAVFSSGTINNTNWHHVAVTHDGVTSKFYIDGSLDATVSFAVSFSSGGNYGIGNRLSHGENLNGYLDEVRVWNRELSASEIYNTMNCELCGSQIGLLAYYKFNQGAAGGNNSGINTLSDASGNAHHGTLNNFTLSGNTSNWVLPGAVTVGNSCPSTTYYQDADGDGYGNPAITQQACTLPSGFVTNNTDCNDTPVTGATIHPGATEVCNGIDDDCDGLVDEMLPPGAKTYLPFSGNANDASGNGHNGTVNGPVLTTDRSGFANSAYYFDGNNQYINCTNDAQFLLSKTFSISVWYNIENRPGGWYQNVIISNLGYSNSSGGYQFHTGNPAAPYAGLYRNTSYSDQVAQGTITIQPNQWYNQTMVVTYDLNNNTTQISNYINGTFDNAATFSGYVSYNNISNVTIGTNIDGFNGYQRALKGKIDDVVLYDRALTQGEITLLYQNQGSIISAATEICNGIDDNCNGQIDEGVTTTYYQDADGDGYGNPAITQQACTPPSGYVTNNTDCNDTPVTGVTIHPGATEVCNGIDDDCDGLTDESPPPGIKLYLPFSGNALDFSGNNFNGAVYNATLTTDRFGNSNCAYYFNGNARIEIPDNPNLRPTSLTACAWVYLENGSSFWEHIISKPLCNSYYNSYVMYLRDTYLGYGIGGNGYSPLNDATAATFNQWIYVTMTFDDATNTLKYYTNGNLVSSIIENNSIQYDNSPLMIGGDLFNCGLYDLIQGKIDEVMIFDRALSSTEINNLYLYLGIQQSQTTYYQDADGDGYGNPAVTQQACTPPSGYVTNNTDCNDTPISGVNIHPGAAEVCNGIDDDCDGFTDEGVSTTYYLDADGDGYGNPSVSQVACTQPTNYVTNNTDCNDTPVTGANIHPGATELINGIDDDCDGFIEKLIAGAEYYFDNDPGVGNGTAIPVATGGFSTNYSGTVSIASLNPGFHKMCVRTKDDLGHWSLFEARTFYIVPPASANSSNVVAAEYYFDTDPGVGNGTSISITSGNTANYSGVISIGSLTPGFHKMCVRTKDDLGRWSLFEARSFYIYQIPATSSQVAAAEYFYDNDPGIGNGTAIIVTPASTVNYCGQINVPVLSNGTHNLIIRTRDNNGKWSLFESRTFTVTGSGIVSVTPAGPVSVCATSVLLTANTTGGPYTYQWYQGCDPINGATASTYIATTSGNYYVAVTSGSNSEGSNVVSVILNPPPTIFNLTGGGSYCSVPGTGSLIGLDGSQNGVNYQLVIGGNTNVGSPIAGNNGNPISFGSQTVAGAYTVVASNGSCTSTMNGSAIVSVITATTWYEDFDTDGFGNASVSQLACVQPSGLVSNNTDCNDNNINIYQSANLYIDNDNDNYDAGQTLVCYGATIPSGYKATTLGTDCYDNDVSIHPNATEVCNGIDDNCDNQIDEGVAIPNANAGPDQTICTTTATMAANSASPGIGVWTLINGTGTITTPSSPVTTVTSIGVGSTVLRWTITKDLCTSFDEVTITNNTISANHHYRSKQTGNWTSPSTWEIYNGCGWVNAATYPVYNNSDSIVISRDDAVTVNISVTVDQLAVDSGAILNRSAGGSITINDGPGTDMLCFGVFAYNTLLQGIGTEIEIDFKSSSTLGYIGTGVSFSGTIDIEAGSIWSFNNPIGSIVLNANTILNNYTTFNWINGDIYLDGIFNNYGVFNIQCQANGNSLKPNGWEPGTFNNHFGGIINKNNSALVRFEHNSLMPLKFNNHGQINVNAGTLEYVYLDWINSVHEGNYYVAYGATLGGDYLLFSGSTFQNEGTVSIFEVYLNGTGSQNYVNNRNTNHLEFMGTGSQVLSGTGSITTLGINNLLGVGLAGNQIVLGNMGLTNGILSLNNFDLQLNGSFVGGGLTSYLRTNGTGVLKKKTNSSSSVLQIGNSTFNPVTVAATFVSNDTLSCRVIDNVYSSYDGNDNPTGLAFSDYAVNRTWLLHRSTTGTANITLQWNASDELPGFNRNSSRVGHYTGGEWNMNTQSNSSGAGPYTKTLNGVTSFSPFSIFTADVTCTNAFTAKCSGDAISIPYTAVGNYKPGNIFTAQLSNSAGSFASPVNIGSVTASSSGVIAATIPLASPAGTGYRVRVVSSSPGLTGSTNNGSNFSITLPILYYIDADVDGFGAVNDAGIYSCTPVAGRVTNHTDCNDNNQNIYPGAPEICGNGIDDNCNGLLDENNSVAATSINATLSQLCAGSSTTLSVVGGSLGANASWKWYRGTCGGILVGTGSSITVAPTVTTTYFVRAEGLCPPTSCAQKVITVNTNSANLPLPTISGKQTGLCGQSNVVYTATCNGATGFIWTVPSSATIVNQVANTITVNYSTNFSLNAAITVRGTNSCGTSAIRSINVSPKFAIPVISGLNYACPYQQGLIYTCTPVAGASGYQWTVVQGSIIVNGTGTTSITVNWGGINGLIKVKAIGGNSCASSDQASFAVSFTCRDEYESEGNSNIQIFPNPTDGKSLIVFDAETEGEVKINIYDALGKLVLAQPYKTQIGKNETEIDLKEFVSGYYMLRVVGENSIQIAKLVKN